MVTTGSKRPGHPPSSSAGRLHFLSTQVSGARLGRAAPSPALGWGRLWSNLAPSRGSEEPQGQWWAGSAGRVRVLWQPQLSLLAGWNRGSLQLSARAFTLHSTRLGSSLYSTPAQDSHFQLGL